MPLISTLANASARGYGFTAGGAALSLTGFSSISTVTVGSGGSSSITFSAIPASWKHLQIRMYANFSGSVGAGYFAFNGDNASTNYSFHFLGSDYSTNPGGSISTNQSKGMFTGNSGTSPQAPNMMIMDILDYANTNKHKTVRTAYAWNNNVDGYNELNANTWRNTAAIDSIVLTAANTFANNTHVALYGIEG